MAKAVKWNERDKMSKLANVMYPHLAPKEVREEMRKAAALDGKKGPFEAKLAADKARDEQARTKWKR
jgi:hypothetical protein